MTLVFELEAVFADPNATLFVHVWQHTLVADYSFGETRN
jgi:hypothetical protein